MNLTHSLASSAGIWGSEAINMLVHLSQQGRRLLSYKGKKIKPFFPLILEDTFEFSPLSMMLAVSLDALYQAEEVPFYR